MKYINRRLLSDPNFDDISPNANNETNFHLDEIHLVPYLNTIKELKKIYRILPHKPHIFKKANVNKELYGEDRLLNFMNLNVSTSSKVLLPSLKEDIDKFVGEEPQFDDITMLMFDYKKEKEIVVSKTFLADDSELSNVLGTIEEVLEKYNCPFNQITAICVAVEEVFVNISHYAYGEGKGSCDLIINFNEYSRQLMISIEDKGIPFDPLAKKDPDINLPAEKREIGGLGIFIVKKTMDDVSYRYENGKNILTMIKKI
jgi:sigma-B regulation protein RsbU (phosphoserine phosphatase)